MKRCNRCGEEKPVSEYYANKRMRGGLLNQCRPCVSSSQKNRRIEKAGERKNMTKHVPLKTRILRRSRFVERGCLEWEGSRNKQQYGSLGWRGKLVKAHRASWLAFRGEIPDGQMVLHRCDNPKCVNPNHLFIGSAKDNVADMVAKGRQRPNRGEKHGRAKLTAAQVLSIRSDARPSRVVADELRVHISTVQEIKKRRAWKHV